MKFNENAPKIEKFGMLIISLLITPFLASLIVVSLQAFLFPNVNNLAKGIILIISFISLLKIWAEIYPPENKEKDDYDPYDGYL